MPVPTMPDFEYACSRISALEATIRDMQAQLSDFHGRFAAYDMRDRALTSHAATKSLVSSLPNSRAGTPALRQAPPDRAAGPLTETDETQESMAVMLEVGRSKIVS